nr:acyl-CoA-binding protein [Comamonas jiangduensis]
MSDLNATFEEAVKNSTALSERPDNATLLKIYALYKQATEGDNEPRNPALPTWWAVRGTRGKSSDTTQDEAKQQYIELINSLR